VSLRAAFELSDECLSIRSGERAIDPTIEPYFDKLASLCSLPAIAHKVIQVAEDENSDAKELLEVVEQDTAIASKLMKTVNSAFCGLRNPVGDLHAAISLLGVERVRNLALTVSMGSMYGRPSVAGQLDPERLWDHSVCVATISRLIAKRGGVCHPEEAYLAGLMHDIGLLFVNQHLAELSPGVLTLVNTGMPLHDAERRLLAFDHAQLGAYVAWRSSFPARLVAAIDNHHTPAGCSEDSAALTRVVFVANYLATRYGRGSIEGRRLPAPPEGILLPIGLNLLDLRSVWAELPETMQTVSSLTGV
jgi:putative nucleotidyltransferase with HDIG domain